MIDDFAEFDADCAVRLRLFHDWARRAPPDGGQRAFAEFLAGHPLTAEDSGARGPRARFDREVSGRSAGGG
jgi:hypothetical protein